MSDPGPTRFTDQAERERYLRERKERGWTSQRNFRLLVVSAILTALGILFPLIMPKIMIPPFSMTLASHVPLLVAMFLSPVSTVAVAIGTTIGFLFALPVYIAARAATQIIFAMIGTMMLRRKPELLDKPLPMIGFAALLGLIHAAGEVLVVMPFFFGSALPPASMQAGFFYSVLLLTGVGTFIHHMFDFTLARAIWQPLQKLAVRYRLLDVT